MQGFNFIWRKPDLHCHSSMHLMYKSCLLPQNKEFGEAEGNQGPLALQICCLSCALSPPAQPPLPGFGPELPQLWGHLRAHKGKIVGHMSTKVHNLPSGTSTLLGLVYILINLPGVLDQALENSAVSLGWLETCWRLLLCSCSERKWCTCTHKHRESSLEGCSSTHCMQTPSARWIFCVKPRQGRSYPVTSEGWEDPSRAWSVCTSPTL